MERKKSGIKLYTERKSRFIADKGKTKKEKVRPYSPINKITELLNKERRSKYGISLSKNLNTK